MLWPLLLITALVVASACGVARSNAAQPSSGRVLSRLRVSAAARALHILGRDAASRP